MGWFKRLTLLAYGLAGLLSLAALGLVWLGPWQSEFRAMLEGVDWYRVLVASLAGVAAVGHVAAVGRALFGGHGGRPRPSSQDMAVASPDEPDAPVWDDADEQVVEDDAWLYDVEGDPLTAEEYDEDQMSERRGRWAPRIVLALLAVVAVAVAAYVAWGNAQRVTLSAEEPGGATTVSSGDDVAGTSETGAARESGDSGDKVSSTTDKSSGGSADKTSKATTKASGVADPWLRSGKRFSTGNSRLDEEVKSFCDGIASTDMDKDVAALEVYKGVAWANYVERDQNQHPSGKDWRIEYALQFFDNGLSGNCYEFASTLQFCLQYLGFEDAHAEAVLVELSSGNWGDHGLVYVTNTDGRSCLCDTAKGTNGWMLDANVYNTQPLDIEDDA